MCHAGADCAAREWYAVSWPEAIVEIAGYVCVAAVFIALFLS